jgi:DNA invertase Pin-like site-specific DNA recombinase
MYGHISRFVTHPDEKIIASLDPILGRPGWRGRLDPTLRPERKMISERTKAALVAAKARGVQLGGRPEKLKRTSVGRRNANAARRATAEGRAADLMPTIRALQGNGITTLAGIAKALNEQGIAAPRGGQWRPVQVQRVMQRLG